MTSCQHEAIYVLKCPFQQSTAESFSVDNLPNVVHCFFYQFYWPQKVNEATE